MAGNEVVVKLRGDKQDLNESLNQADDTIGKWAGKIKGVLAGLAVAFAAKKVFDIGASFVMGADEEAAQMVKLESVLKATSNAAGITAEEFSKLAADAQKYNGVADDVYIKNAAVMATFKNINGDVFKEAMTAAADMAAVMDGDLSGSVMQISKALNDPKEGINALARAGVKFTDAQKDMIESLVDSGDVLGAQRIILGELESQFGGTSEALTKTFGGQLKQAEMAIGDMGEAIGGALIPYLEMLMPVVIEGISAFQNLLVSVLDMTGVSEEFSESWTKYLIDTLKWSVQVGADVFSFFEWAFTNFSMVVERDMFSATLSITGLVEDIKHLFTEVAPAYINWFFDNWSNILTDYANFSATIYSNMFTNISGFFTSVASWLSGGEASFEWTALTDGFEATMDALPEIAARKTTEFEKYLASDIARMDNQMGKSWVNIFEKNNKLVDEMFKPVERKEIELVTTQPKIDPPKPEDNKKTKKEIEDGIQPELESKVQVDVETTFGKSSGLEELNKQISEGSADNAKKQAEANEKRQEELDKFIAKLMKDNARDAVKVNKPAGKAGVEEINAGGNSAQSAGKSGSESILNAIYDLLYDHQPRLLKAVESGGGLA